jgi:phosphotransferase system HPr-like phosphotransfer protein
MCTDTKKIKKVSLEFQINFYFGWVRTSSRFTETCRKFRSSIEVSCSGEMIDGKELLPVISVLGSVSEPRKPTTVTICGLDAEDAMDEVEKTIEALNADFTP